MKHLRRFHLTLNKPQLVKQLSKSKRFLVFILKFSYGNFFSFGVKFYEIQQMYIDSYNYHHNQDKKQFLHLPKVPWATPYSNTLTIPIFLATTDLFIVSKVFPFPERYTVAITQDVAFHTGFSHCMSENHPSCCIYQ